MNLARALTALLRRNRSSDRGAPAASIAASMDELVDGIRGKVSLEIQVRVEQIREQIRGILRERERGDEVGLATVRQIATDYVPSAIRNYLQLPPEYAMRQPVREGKTAHQLLVEQLETIKADLARIAHEMQRSDRRRVIEQGFVIEERFRSDDR